METAELVAVAVGQDCGQVSSFGGSGEAPGSLECQLHSRQLEWPRRGQAACREQPPPRPRGSLLLTADTNSKNNTPEWQRRGGESRCQQGIFTQKCHTAQEAHSGQMWQNTPQIHMELAL